MKLSVYGIVAAAALSMFTTAQSHAAATGSYTAKATVTSENPDIVFGPIFTTVGADTQGFGRGFFFETLLDDQLQLRTRLFPDPAPSATYPVNATLEFGNFDLTEDGLPLQVLNATFNAVKTDLEQYADFRDFIGPVVSFADNTLTIDMGYKSTGIAGDQPDHYFDLETAAVPVSAALPLMATAIAALGFVRWRKRQTA